jgi:hypothetical protein
MAESDEVKAEITAEAEAEHLVALKEFNNWSIIPEKSAEEYHQYVAYLLGGEGRAEACTLQCIGDIR